MVSALPARFAGVVLFCASMMLAGCSSWRPGGDSTGAPGEPARPAGRTQFRRGGDGTPFFFLDDRARQIESSLGVGERN